VLVGVHVGKLLSLSQALSNHACHGISTRRRRCRLSSTLSTSVSAMLTRVTTRVFLGHFVSTKMREKKISLV
jgi:hypothetical protein